MKRELRFDVEYRYKATQTKYLNDNRRLRFDVEYRYKATLENMIQTKMCCGLM